MASSSSVEYNMGILGVKKPMDCSCQELLSTPGIVFHGWLRKRSLRNKLISMNWPQVYVIVANRCLYYYSSEVSKKPSGSVSLYGFNRICRANRAKVKDVVWAFKLDHIQPTFPSLYFSAPSENEMVKWMMMIKQEILTANGKSSTAGDSQYGESIASEDSWGSSEYNFLESSIYDDVVFQRPISVLEEKDSDFEEDEGITTSGIPFEPSIPNYLVPLAPIDLPEDDKEKVAAVSEAVYCLERVTIQEEEPKEDDYWKTIWFDGSKVDAASLIKTIADDGVYLVRKSEDDSNVLVVYAGKMKKYKLLKKANGSLTLSSTEPEFNSLEDLLYHYYSNDLPNSEQKLVCPFKLHEDYHKLTSSNFV